MKTGKYAALLLPLIGTAAFAAPKEDGFLLALDRENPMYADIRSIREHPQNTNLLVYEMVTNMGGDDKDLRGTSMVEKHYLDCNGKIDILNPESAKIYSRFFGKGELVYTIPMESRRKQMKEISPLSIISAVVCKVAGRDFGGNPDALADMKKELDKMERKQGRKK